MLHVTNGDSVVESFRLAGMEGEYLTWRDVLHEGPVPDTPGLPEIRAKFLTRDGGPVTYEDALQSFVDRDAALKRPHDEVVLWFEHDLYDQLQLIQILAMCHENPVSKLTLIQASTYLGCMRPEKVASLLPTRQAVTKPQLELGWRAWKAFTSDSPGGLNLLLGMDTPALPYLAGAIRRLLMEYPSTHTGFSRTEDLVVRAAASGYRSKEAIFRAVNRSEDPVFLGDCTVFRRIDELAGQAPVLTREPASVTPLGWRILAQEADNVRDRGGIDRWIGGVHLHGEDTPWRYSPETQTVVQSR